MTTIEEMAQIFCEASGLYKWEETHGILREWYLAGAKAIHDRFLELPS